LGVTGNLETYILESLPDGLSYNEAAQLCLRLYCTVHGIPSDLHTQCSKDGLAAVFARLARRGFLTRPASFAVLYGANFHEVTDKGHWIEVIASIFKKSEPRDHKTGEAVVERLTKQSNRRDETQSRFDV
jgi:hypothetical protein